MLHHPTLEKLQQLRLNGMHKALREQLAVPDIAVSVQRITSSRAAAVSRS
jgi:hypothetical protein